MEVARVTIETSESRLQASKEGLGAALTKGRPDPRQIPRTLLAEVTAGAGVGPAPRAVWREKEAQERFRAPAECMEEVPGGRRQSHP